MDRPSEHLFNAADRYLEQRIREVEARLPSACGPVQVRSGPGLCSATVHVFLDGAALCTYGKAVKR